MSVIDGCGSISYRWFRSVSYRCFHSACYRRFHTCNRLGAAAAAAEAAANSKRPSDKGSAKDVAKSKKSSAKSTAKAPPPPPRLFRWKFLESDKTLTDTSSYLPSHLFDTNHNKVVFAKSLCPKDSSMMVLGGGATAPKSSLRPCTQG